MEEIKELEIGEFVRTKNGIIDKIERYSYDCCVWYCKEGMCIDKCNAIGTHLTDIVKHSKNIINLIEVGDILEVYFPIRKITKKIVVDEYFKDSMILNGINYRKIFLKTILTKEQFARESYKVVEE